MADDAAALRAYGAATALAGAGKWPEAAARAQEAVALKPDYWEAWQLLGNCRHQAGDTPGALECWKKSTEIHPANEELKEYAGRARLDLQKQMREMVDSERMFQGMADTAAALATLRDEAGAHFDAGRLDEAEAVARRAIRTNGKNWEAWRIVADCQLARGDRRSALQSYNRVVEFNPDARDVKELIKKLIAAAFGGGPAQ